MRASTLRRAVRPARPVTKPPALCRARRRDSEWGQICFSLRVFLAMLVFAMSACVTACVSSQTLETPVISEQAKDKLLPKDKLLRIESLNRSHAPYRDYSITMNIRSPSFEKELTAWLLSDSKLSGRDKALVAFGAAAAARCQY